MKYDRQKIADMRNAGHTYKQIAEELGTTAANISSQVSMMKKTGWDITKSTKWSPEEIERLIKLRQTTDMTIPEMAIKLGRPYDRVKRKISQLIKAGEIPPKSHQSSPTGSYSYQKSAPKSTVQELLQYVVNYPSRDSCPDPYRSRIVRHFGSWGTALKAAGVTSNIGGNMDPTKPTTLYLLDFGDFLKFGITQRTIAQRFSGAPPYTVLDTYTSDLDAILALEREISENVREYALIPADPWFERNGKTECFVAPNFSSNSVQSQHLKLEDLI